MTGPELRSYAAKEWNKLTKEEKNVYKTRAKELNERPAADLTESEMQLDRTALFKDIQKKVSV